MQAKLTYQARFPISPHARKTKRKLVRSSSSFDFFFARSLFFSLMTENQGQTSGRGAPWREKGTSTLKPVERHFLRPWHAHSPELQFQLFLHALFLSKCYFFQTEFKLSDRIIPASTLWRYSYSLQMRTLLVSRGNVTQWWQNKNASFIFLNKHYTSIVKRGILSYQTIKQ